MAAVKSTAKLSTLALHTPPPPAAWEGGATRHLAPPITTSATFVLPTGEEVSGEPVYGRYGNPSRLQLEATLAALEGANHCLTFSSGMAAICAVLDTLRVGDGLVASKQLYGGTMAQIKEAGSRGVTVSLVDGTKPEEVAAAVDHTTKMVWLEVCTNPGLLLLDLSAVVEAVRSRAGPACVIAVDNTFLTPWVVRPLDFGVDLVMHSCTKYINGHSDVIMGALLINSPDLYKKMFAVQRYRGAVPSPFDCYLVLRSLATLDIRMARHQATGLVVARWLEQQEQVRGVQHPLLPSHTQHALAVSQHKGRHSGMLAFSLASETHAETFLSSLKLVRCAASLGSTHSLACQPARLTHGPMVCTDQDREDAGVGPGLVRISCGLEEAEDIIQDLAQALLAIL